jgi:hypothetical protein
MHFSPVKPALAATTSFLFGTPMSQALGDDTRRRNDPVISLNAKQQCVDWCEFRHRDVHSTEVRREVGRFGTYIRDALCRPQVLPDERKQQQQAGAERHLRMAEAERRAEEERGGRQSRSQARPLWSRSRSALLASSLIGLVLLGAIGAWLATPPTHRCWQSKNGALKPGGLFKECAGLPGNGRCPGKTNTMGGPTKPEQPPHTVTITKPFAVPKYELTFADLNIRCRRVEPACRGHG